MCGPAPTGHTMHWERGKRGNLGTARSCAHLRTAWSFVHAWLGWALWLWTPTAGHDSRFGQATAACISQHDTPVLRLARPLGIKSGLGASHQFHVSRWPQLCSTSMVTCARPSQSQPITTSWSGPRYGTRWADSARFERFQIPCSCANF
jgi:hypothetical protein